MDAIIKSIRRYIGSRHPWARGTQVVVVAVQRCERILDDDASIGELCDNDVVEFAPLVRDGSGLLRTSFVTSDARPDELGASEGRYEGETRTYLVIEEQKPIGRG